MFLYPHYYTPTPEAQAASQQVMARVRSYMASHPNSELHHRGKMFGVLVVESKESKEGIKYLAAFSGVLDGSYWHKGFVGPIYEVNPNVIIGKDREDSQAKQRWLFAQYQLLNARGEQKSVSELWAEGFAPEMNMGIPPSGTGECCAPKLLQAAYQQGLHPISMAEFWMGASPKDELRKEGYYYPACIAKCRPLLRYMLQGIEVEENPLITRGRLLAKETNVLYEDQDIIVVSKPSGLLTVPGKEEQYSLEEYINEKDTRQKTQAEKANIKAVHRLDMDTSGIVILAKNESSYIELQRQFAQHEVQKIYRARVQRQNTCTCAMSEGEGTISLPLLANPMDRPRQIVDWQHGKRAVTNWKNIDNQSNRRTDGQLIELYPQTGRTHQLRVHCAHPEGLNAPILGDRLYGDGVGRLMLHAYQITFAHPTTGERMTITDEAENFSTF